MVLCALGYGIIYYFSSIFVSIPQMEKQKQLVSVDVFYSYDVNALYCKWLTYNHRPKKKSLEKYIMIS